MVNEETIRVGDNPDHVRGLDYGYTVIVGGTPPYSAWEDL